MKSKETQLSITVTSANAAGTSVAASSFKGNMLTKAEGLVIDATLTGATGGTLDVYLQRKVADDSWFDWVHFPQLADGAATKRYTVTITGNGSTIVEVGGGSDASPGVALAANTAVDVTPGGDVRIVFVAGVGTSAGAAQTINITPYTENF
jgi:hypothetical protein